jgi:hypothetical protein
MADLMLQVSSMRHPALLPITLLSTALLVSCMTPKPAPDAFADAEQAIDAAVRAGAEEHSPVELRFAREKLSEAREGMEARQYAKATYLIEQSEINSELGIEKSRTAETRAQVARMVRENEVLKEDFRATFGEEAL